MIFICILLCVKKYIEWLINMVYRGILYGIFAAFSYSLMTLGMKLLDNRVNGIMVVFFRFLVSTAWVTVVLIHKKINHNNVIKLSTAHFTKYLVRSFSTVFSMICLYYSLKFVPLANANTLNLSYTIFIPIIGYIFYRYHTSLQGWSSIILGFVGILIVLNPNVSGFNIMSLFSLFSGIFIAISLIAASEIAKCDSVYTIMGIHFWLTFFITGMMVIFNWQAITFSTVLLLIFSGIMATLYQEFLTRGIKCVSIKLIAPLQYFGIVFSGILDWLLWNHIPNFHFILGSIVILASCYLVSCRKNFNDV